MSSVDAELATSLVARVGPLGCLTNFNTGPGESLLAATVAMGFSVAVARAGLRAEFKAWMDVGTDVVDVAAPAPTLVIAARTLPVSALRQVLLARLGGAAVLLKAASGQEAMARAIAAADPGVEVVEFSGGDRDAFRAAVARAARVVVLGDDATITQIEADAPAGVEVVGFGHRVSAAWIHEPNQAELVDLARDVCAWDQAGCMSPQVVWATGDPEALVKPLAGAIAAIEGRLPMLLPPTAARARNVAKTCAQMLGVAQETQTAVIATMPTSEYRASPGYRFIWLLPASAVALSNIAPVLSTVGTNVELALPNTVRQCPLGQMQQPPLSWVNR